MISYEDDKVVMDRETYRRHKIRVKKLTQALERINLVGQLPVEPATYKAQEIAEMALQADNEHNPDN